ncbi:MAG: hypothetical protein R3F37_08375 [Candidatus Competibacteraceae bacterium]
MLVSRNPDCALEIRETRQGIYLAHWTYSSSTNMQPPTAVFPEHCQFEDPRLDCGERGLYGRLSFERLGLSYSAVVVRLTRLDQSTQSITLTGAEPSIVLTPDGRLPLSQVFASYVPLGFDTFCSALITCCSCWD